MVWSYSVFSTRILKIIQDAANHFFGELPTAIIKFNRYIITTNYDYQLSKVTCCMQTLTDRCEAAGEPKN